MTRRMFRYDVPVDGFAHAHPLTSDPVAVGSRRLGVVEFWAEDDFHEIGHEREFRIFGTGHEVPEHAVYWGTTYDARTPDLVWHLYEVTR